MKMDRPGCWDVAGPFVVLAFTLCVMGALGIGLASFARINCHTYGEIIGRETQYRWVGLSPYCFVRADNGRWIDRDQLREVID